ncbi:hypothetical protein Lbir_0442 [Legionella birminghamensis]|uniref:Uncharacterized protein n=1 Tax=Legionella birminghamensis TaxID=28083 RepID=A0A378ILS2_9GAMM|nr:hypothetical protein [Legionella birminghamensis]KTC75297.1 hypothetical protein Lbir_0442 [Legionella birminghamensis]STX33064.1 Uncharacterised protein [Legionella birminghamensis]
MSIAKIVEQAIAHMKNELKRLHRVNATAYTKNLKIANEEAYQQAENERIKRLQEAVDHMFAKTISQAYEEAVNTVEESKESINKKVYQRFALFLHPDRMDNEFNELLKSDYGLDPKMAFQQLDAANKGTRTLGKLFDGGNVMDNIVEWIKFLMSATHYFLFADERYPQPLRFIAKLLNETISVFIIVTGIAALVALGFTYLMVESYSMIERFIFNLFTGDEYDKAILEDLNDAIHRAKNDPEQIALAKANVIVNHRMRLLIQGIDLGNGTDEQIFDRLVEAVARERSMLTPEKTPSEEQLQDARVYLEVQIKQEAIEEAKQNVSQHPILFGHLKRTGQALIRNIFGPFTGGWFSSTLSFLIYRPFLIVASPFFLGLAAAVETARLLNILAVGALPILAIAAKVASTLVINGPIFLIDALAAAGRGLKNLFCGPKNEKSQEFDYSQYEANDFKFVPENQNGGPQAAVRGLGVNADKGAAETSHSHGSRQEAHHSRMFGKQHRVEEAIEFGDEEKASCCFGG